MRRIYILAGICIWLLSHTSGYAQTTKPAAKSKNYPVTVQSSPQRSTQAEREWTRLLDTFGIKYVQPDFYPITQTPRSLSTVQGGLKLLTVKPKSKDETVSIREAFKRFIDRWRDLLNANPDTVSLASSDDSNGSYRMLYKQLDYPFPVAGGYGLMTVVVTGDGVLTQLDDRFIPVVELPYKPSIDREAVMKRVAGRTFNYKDISGGNQTVKINDEKEVRVKGLTILPIEKKDALEIHLAWEITAGTSLPFTIFIDAMDGTDLRVEQNFKT